MIKRITEMIKKPEATGNLMPFLSAYFPIITSNKMNGTIPKERMIPLILSRYPEATMYKGI